MPLRIPEVKWLILNEDKEVVETDDLLLMGAQWANPAIHFVADTYIANGLIRVSTIFLHMDVSFGWGRPILFETKIFINLPVVREGEDEVFYGHGLGSYYDDWTNHYATWHEAKADQFLMSLDTLRAATPFYRTEVRVLPANHTGSVYQGRPIKPGIQSSRDCSATDPPSEARWSS